MRDNGRMWRLVDGGWAFQYPDMVSRVDESGRTRIVWDHPAQPPLSVEMDGDGISYQFADTVVHRDTSGATVYDQPSGTVHQDANGVIYHWCKPNVVVYQMPSGIIYYDDSGMTFRGQHDVAHYARSGEVVYQGLGGLTRQFPDGSATLWTPSGVVIRHHDGLVTYTPAGESEEKVLAGEALAAERFDGPPLTARQVWEMVEKALAPAPAPAPSVAASLPLIPMAGIPFANAAGTAMPMPVTPL